MQYEAAEETTYMYKENPGFVYTRSAMFAIKPTEPLDSWSELLFSCPQDVKETVYKGLMHLVLEYGSSVWYSYCVGLDEELEKVKNCAAMFVTRNYSYEPGSMTGILGELKWETL